MPGASAQTRAVKILNANWKPASAPGEPGRFELLLITDDDERVALPVTADDLTAIVALARADTVLVWDPTNQTLIAANIIGEMPWTRKPPAGRADPAHEPAQT